MLGGNFGGETPAIGQKLEGGLNLSILVSPQGPVVFFENFGKWWFCCKISVHKTFFRFFKIVWKKGVQPAFQTLPQYRNPCQEISEKWTFFEGFLSFDPKKKLLSIGTSLLDALKIYVGNLPKITEKHFEIFPKSPKSTKRLLGFLCYLSKILWTLW